MLTTLLLLTIWLVLAVGTAAAWAAWRYACDAAHARDTAQRLETDLRLVIDARMQLQRDLDEAKNLQAEAEVERDALIELLHVRGIGVAFRWADRGGKSIH